MKTPFEILEVPETASDELIKQAYLQKVRQSSPEHAPAQFQEIRTAFEAIQTYPQRLKYQLFHHQPPTLETFLQPKSWQRPSEDLLIQVLTLSLQDPFGEAQ